MGATATNEMNKVKSTTFCILCRKLRSRILWLYFGLIIQTMSRKGSKRPRKKMANGAVISDQLFFGVLTINALSSPSLIA